jgi:transcriptional regulator of acetoin/glycerol metabolism
MRPTAPTISREFHQRTAPQPGAAQLFVVAQCDRPLEASLRCSLEGCDEVALRRGAARRAIRSDDAQGATIEVVDQSMSRAHAVLRRILGAWTIEDGGSRNGTFVDGAPIHCAALSDGALVECGRTFFLFRSALPAPPVVVSANDVRAEAPGFATLVPSLAEELGKVAALARSTVPVVICGETGAGKEVVAAGIHALSGRKGPLQAINCGALAATLVESELFGYRKGAFSGADEDRPGLVRAADHGTLFLDEIGDLPLPAQAVLLRVLQEGQVRPVGAAKAVAVDLRVLSATNRDLDALVGEGKFRADLLARLTGFVVRLPPLRERREDLGLLVAALLRRLSPERCVDVTFTIAAMRALLRYRWPANVRELERCLQAAVVLAGSGPVDVAHLPPAVAQAASAAATPSHVELELPVREQRRRDQLVAALRDCAGNVTAAARALGRARGQVQRWIRRYGIDRTSFLR